MCKKSRLYTRSGDKGTTSLIGGKRIAKTHLRLEAYGTIDELNAYIGYLITYLETGSEYTQLVNIQHRLFEIGCVLATDEADQKTVDTYLKQTDITSLEQAIDQLDATTPEQRSFILPGGSRAAAVCHICRTVCRRAERRILALDAVHHVPIEVTAYVNRLSDYLFILSRKINFNAHIDEIPWTKR
jgi:cob(I)alamin adenosyltransferase